MSARSPAPAAWRAWHVGQLTDSELVERLRSAYLAGFYSTHFLVLPSGIWHLGPPFRRKAAR
jgi:hypothetical protein